VVKLGIRKQNRLLHFLELNGLHDRILHRCPASRTTNTTVVIAERYLDVHLAKDSRTVLTSLVDGYRRSTDLRSDIKRPVPESAWRWKEGRLKFLSHEPRIDQITLSILLTNNKKTLSLKTLFKYVMGDNRSFYH
jgi:hypothetical protein